MCSYWKDDITLTIERLSEQFIEVVKASDKKTYVRLFFDGRWCYYPMRKVENLKKYPVGRYSKVFLKAVMYRPTWIDKWYSNAIDEEFGYCQNSFSWLF